MAEMSREEVISGLRDLMMEHLLSESEARKQSDRMYHANFQKTITAAIALLSQQEQEKQNDMASIPLNTVMVAMDALAMVEIDYSKAGRRARRKSDTTSAIMAEEMLEKVRDNREVLRRALGKQ